MIFDMHCTKFATFFFCSRWSLHRWAISPTDISISSVIYRKDTFIPSSFNTNRSLSYKKSSSLTTLSWYEEGSCIKCFFPFSPNWWSSFNIMSHTCLPYMDLLSWISLRFATLTAFSIVESNDPKNSKWPSLPTPESFPGIINWSMNLPKSN